MKHTMKRGFSLAVALCMVLSLLSLPGVSVARAAGAEDFYGDLLYSHNMDLINSGNSTHPDYVATAHSDYLPLGWTRSGSSQNFAGGYIKTAGGRTYYCYAQYSDKDGNGYGHVYNATIFDETCVLSYDFMVNNSALTANWTVLLPSFGTGHSSHSLGIKVSNEPLAGQSESVEGVPHYLQYGQNQTLLTAGQWYHLDLVLNGETVTVYLDNQEFVNADLPAGNLNYLLMGYYGAAATETKGLGMNIDELKVYDYVPATGGEEEDSNIVIAGTNVTLENNLDMNFYVEKADLPAETANVKAVLTRTYANGSDDHEVEVPFAQWTSYGDYYYITYTGMTAKSMTDSVTVQIFDGEEQISEDYTDTIAAYAKRMFGSEDLDDKWDPVYAAMLKYGAAAQTTWNYGTGAMADADMTQAMLNAIPSVSANYAKTGDETYKGMTMKLENTIETQMVFSGISEGMTAEVSYTKYNAAQPTTFTVEFDDMVSYGGSIYGVKIDSLVVADVDSEITVTIMNGEDEVATATDCIAGYVTRMSNGSDVFSAIYTLGNAAYTAFTAN